MDCHDLGSEGGSVDGAFVSCVVLCGLWFWCLLCCFLGAWSCDMCSRSWVVGFRVWSVGCGVWSVKCGVWSVGCGVWGAGCGVWAVGCGLCGVGCGVRGVGCSREEQRCGMQSIRTTTHADICLQRTRHNEARHRATNKRNEPQSILSTPPCSS